VTRLRRADTTRNAERKQSDDGIGNTLVLGLVRVGTLNRAGSLDTVRDVQWCESIADTFVQLSCPHGSDLIATVRRAVRAAGTHDDYGVRV